MSAVVFPSAVTRANVLQRPALPLGLAHRLQGFKIGPTLYRWSKGKRAAKVGEVPSAEQSCGRSEEFRIAELMCGPRVCPPFDRVRGDVLRPFYTKCGRESGFISHHMPPGVPFTVMS